MADSNHDDDPIRVSGAAARGGAADDPVEISGTEARGGSTPRMTRYILVFSLILVIVVFVLIYLGFGW